MGFSYIPDASFTEEFLLHSSSWFDWESFCYTPRAGFTEEFLLHSSSWLYWGVSLTLLELVLVRSFSDTSRAGYSDGFFLHSLC